MCKKNKCAGQYTVDLINNNIRRNVQEDVQTGCTGYLHGSNTNGRKIINDLLIIKWSHVDVLLMLSCSSNGRAWC